MDTKHTELMRSALASAASLGESTGRLCDSADLLNESAAEMAASAAKLSASAARAVEAFASLMAPPQDGVIKWAVNSRREKPASPPEKKASKRKPEQEPDDEDAPAPAPVSATKDSSSKERRTKRRKIDAEEKQLDKIAHDYQARRHLLDFGDIIVMRNTSDKDTILFGRVRKAPKKKPVAIEILDFSVVDRTSREVQPDDILFADELTVMSDMGEDGRIQLPSGEYYFDEWYDEENVYHLTPRQMSTI